MAFERASFQHHFYNPGETVEEIAENLSKDMDALAFVYPRSVSQQTDKSTLYSKKDYGLVHSKIAILGLPVWGVPRIESLAEFPLEEEVPLYVRQAVEDLWRTAGFGVHVILPMREKAEDRDASEIDITEAEIRLAQEKPDLWDVISNDDNPLLGNYYSKHIKLLQNFLYGMIRKENLPAHLLRAYREGQRARLGEITPPWFSKDPAVYQTYKKEVPEEKAEDFSDSSSNEDSPAEDKAEARSAASPRSTQSCPTILPSATRHRPPSPLASPHPVNSPVTALHHSDHLPSPVTALHHSTPSSPRSEHSTDSERDSPLHSEHSTDSERDSPLHSERGRPNYRPQYEAQEKARWWKAPLAIVIGLITLPTLIIPALTYWVWKRDKEDDLLQKFEMTSSYYKTLKVLRKKLGTPKLDNHDHGKPRKERAETGIARVDEQGRHDMAITIIADREQARRLRFLMKRAAEGNDKPLNAEEKEFWKTSKQESVKLAPRLGW